MYKFTDLVDSDVTTTTERYSKLDTNYFNIRNVTKNHYKVQNLKLKFDQIPIRKSFLNESIFFTS